MHILQNTSASALLRPTSTPSGHGSTAPGTRGRRTAAGWVVPPRRRWLRRLRWLARAVVVILALVGLLATVLFLTAPPGVGHFRDAAGRQEYVQAYEEAFEALPEPTATHDVPTDHGTVRVYEWAAPETADQVPLVLVPGRGSGVPLWSENLTALAQERRVLAFDALGDAGLSTHTVPFSSFEEQGEVYAQVLARLAPEGAHVLGHSLGGAIAAALAERHPEQVRTLTLLEPVFTLAQPSPDMLWWAMLGSAPGLPEDLRQTALERIGGVDGASEGQGDHDDDPLARMIAAGMAHYAAAIPQPGPLDDAELARLTMPVYVALASTDSMAGGDAAAERAEALPDGTVQVWPDTTHSLPLQAAGELEPVLLEFMAAGE